MRRVNPSMLMLFSFACFALIYLIGAQQRLSSASPMRLQDDPTSTATATATGGQSYFVTATEAATEEVVFLGGEATLEPRGTQPVNRSATATATRTPTPINVGNFVWDDIDHDGRQDAGEPGLANVTVQIWNSTKTALLDSDTTDANGIYQVTVAGPGNYRVRAILPSANDTFSPKNQASGDDQLDSDINPSGANFGFTDTYIFASNLISTVTIDIGIIKFRTPTPTRTPTPVNFGNFVWDDVDHDGRQDVGEPGLANVTVQLWNSAKTSLIDQDVTTVSGNYTLQSPGPGDYRIRVILPNPSDTFSPKDAAGGDDQLDSDINPSGADLGFTDIYAIASNVISIVSIDAGIIKYRTPTPTRTPTPISIGNFVWDDLNENGRQDSGEPGIEGVTVQLWNADKSLLLDETETNASGIYSVIAPVPGSYRVRVLKPSTADTFSPKNAPGSDQDLLDSDINPTGVDAGFTDVFTLASNLISTTIVDAGIITADPVTIGDSVWYDIDGDGIHEAGEPGIAGRRVRLRRHGPIVDVTVSSTLTNANGIYHVVAPAEGTYYLCVVMVSGEFMTDMDATDGGFLPDLRDSDFQQFPLSNGLGCTNDFNAVAGGLFNNAYDAGFEAPFASIVGQLTLQGRQPAPHVGWSVPVRVRIVPSGGGAAVYDAYVLTDTSGVFIVGGIPTGNYDVWVKHDHTLATLNSVNLVPGNNDFDFGTLREGDANNDNIITVVDFSILAATFGKASSDAGYDARADFNNDTLVTLPDFSLLANNFSQLGEPMP